MTYLQAIFLATIQGLTEFLPISSSGHLVIFQKLFGLKPLILFDILVHVGTLMAIIFYFRRELIKIVRGVFGGRVPDINISYMVLLGTIPAAIVGFFLQNYIGQVFDSLKLVGVSFLITGSLLFSIKLIGGRKIKRHLGRWQAESHDSSEVEDLKWQDSLAVGLFQAMAILPGVSRSGSTIVAGLWRGLKQETAFRFSFFLAIPAILGALVLQIPDLASGQFNNLNKAVLGMVISCLVGYFSLRMLERFLARGKLWIFGFYCLIAGILLMFLPKLLV